ncbi:hypothetical protein [Amycolatopsis sp. NPDC051071]|uniref:hypothetical protein n=1 Tax=Amycolatopsis sp. NPDC051071 TaxID=3154637 RepID=UPI003422A18C
MTNNLDIRATALYVKIDDLLEGSPELRLWRPVVGIAPKLTDAELVTLAVMQALRGFTSESRWLRHARMHMGHLFRYLPPAAWLQQASPRGGWADQDGDPGAVGRHHALDR